ncbi:hypothetical protein [Cerasicoccus maritimus]|uniref:hypothetical protein n=1 Tax=Cerasicoccus maritimus TaxID=490089 RepID=UPI0028528C6E|nr:hypothetical protein [Cerasicoccus maritimus]
MKTSPEDNPFDPTKLFTDRTGRQKAKLDVLVAFLHERMRLHHEASQSLESDASRVRRMLQSFESRRDDGRLDASPLESSLISQGFALERENRSQDQACWHDLLRLIQPLMEAWNAFEESQAKQEILKSASQTYRLNPEEDYSAKGHSTHNR